MTAGVEVRRDLEFARPDGEPLLLDLHRPAGDATVPVCLYLHGGGWARGTRTDRAAERLEPVARAGVAVASIDYRLSGRATFPTQLDDVRAAVRWLRRCGAEHGLATERIGAWGASAGGHLASLLGLLPDEQDGDSSVQAVVAFFPPTDLLALADDPAEGPPPPFMAGRPPAVPPFEAQLLGLERAADDPERARQASPVSHVHAGAPPFLLVHGDRDGLIPGVQSQRFAAALADAGAPVQRWVLSGANHEDPGFDTPAGAGLVAGFLLGALSG
ncbi:alpha/beta hydrolase [Modestobacter sp. NPDC049651]|uniref:alpha/beta hydrolase n=1 Tax=unclassified Modestobacter TaxID=2643866 RepID=UPI0033C91B4E